MTVLMRAVPQCECLLEWFVSLCSDGMYGGQRQRRHRNGFKNHHDETHKLIKRNIKKNTSTERRDQLRQ